MSEIEFGKTENHVVFNYNVKDQLNLIENLYNKLIDRLNTTNSKLSLENILDIDSRFDNFKPHPDQKWVEEIVKQYCVRYGIWHNNTGDIYNTMTAYLHPFTYNSDLLIIIGKIYALLYFMDDYIGNEKQKHLSESEQKKSIKMFQRITQYLSHLALGIHDPEYLGCTDIEKAIESLFQDIIIEVFSIINIERLDWFKKFISFLLDHLQKAIIEQDTEMIIPIADYIEIRDDVSGMKPAVMLMEFGSRNYLQRDYLKKIGLLNQIEELELLIIRFGGLVNDFFSFHKECIEDQTMFNLIPVVFNNMANECTVEDFLSSINYAGILTKKIKNDIFDCANDIIISSSVLSIDVSKSVARYVEDLVNGALATWHWQCKEGNPRYARAFDTVIFNEVTLGNIR